MNKRYKVLCLNGPHKGQEIETECDYTDEQEADKKRSMMFEVDGITYAGYCRACGQPVILNNAEYFSNTNGYGYLRVDVLHRWCL